jgi:hypothetical protein
MSLEVVLGYITGLKLLNPDIGWPTLLHTAIVIHILDGIMCRLFAHNNGYPRTLWTILGLFFGIWAVATFILLPKRAVSCQQEHKKKEGEEEELIADR